MLGYLESYQADKDKSKKIQKEIGRNSGSIHNDTQTQNPSFKESSSFPVDDPIPYIVPRQNQPREELSAGPGPSNLKRLHKLDSFIVPRTTLGAHPTIDAKWKKMEKEAAWECIARWWYDILLDMQCFWV
jgi:hypothetical protein